MRGDASEVVYVPVKREVYRAVDWAVNRAVYQAVYWEVDWAVYRAVYGAVYPVAGEAVYRDFLQLSEGL